MPDWLDPLLSDIARRHLAEESSRDREAEAGRQAALDPLGALVHTAWGHQGPLHSQPGLAAFGAVAALPLVLRCGW